jgi:hypothetical protein
MMFRKTLRHGMAALLGALVTTGLIVGPASAADPASAQDQCRLEARVLFSLDPVGRVFGIGAVSCAGPVYQINVGVVLTQGSVIVGSGRNVCLGQAQSSVTVPAADPPGVQLWCATATGSYQVSPAGPTFDLGSKRACSQG